MSETKLNGKIILIKPTQQVNEKFAKREFVIETFDLYPQKILLQCVQQNCELLDNYALGQVVDVNVNVRGRDWTNKDGVIMYFNTLEAWSIKIANEDVRSDENAPKSANDLKTKADPTQFEEDADDLPF